MYIILPTRPTQQVYFATCCVPLLQILPAYRHDSNKVYFLYSLYVCYVLTFQPASAIPSTHARATWRILRFGKLSRMLQELQ
jgi:hypothetical protein